MDAEVLEFVLVAAAFLGVFVLLRRWGQARLAPRTPSAPPTPSARPSERPSLAQRALERVGEQAVLFHHHVPPRPEALSFWGGVPLVPTGFEWPHFTPTGGSPRALHFLVQIDCAAIPRDARLGLMPDRGILYFFMDLHWGLHWKWKVLHLDGDRADFKPAVVPAALPRAYGERACWDWPQRDEDWPRLLPRFSFDPLMVSGPELPPFEGIDDDERYVWPGSVDLAGALEQVDGAIVPSRYVHSRYEGGVMQRPYPCFPQDWQAVRITLGHLARAAASGVRRSARRSAQGASGAEALDAAIALGSELWGARADAADPAAPVGPADSEAFWAFLVSVQPVSARALTQAANDALDATLASNAAAGSILDEQAMSFARSRHAFGSRGEHGLHINTPDRMLAAPTDVQGDAAERAREWLLLLELSSRPQIGHHFGEGVLQFYIRPEDLAAGRFDRVDLYATAY